MAPPPPPYTGRSFCFVLTHANGESVVLAADAENEMLEWMQAGAHARVAAGSHALDVLEASPT